MSLKKYLLKNTFVSIILTEGNRDIIIDKIGLPEELYSWISNNVDKKFQLWVANLTKSYGDFLRVNIKSFVNRGEIQPPLLNFMENTLLTIKNIFKENKKPKINIRDYNDYTKYREMKEQWTSISDYANRVTPRPVLEEMTWVEAYEASVEWHESLEASDISAEITDVAPDAEVIHSFADGSKWVDMHTSDCGELGKLMAHCGQTSSDTTVQFIDNNGKFKISVAFNYGGEYTQAKGVGNDKPDEKYDKYMEWLFTNGGKYQFTSYDSEYMGDNDFTVYDLDDDVRYEVIGKHPELEGSKYLKAIQLYDDGDEEGAIDTLNSIQSYGMLNILAFDGSPETVILDIHPSHIDRAFEKVFTFGGRTKTDDMFVSSAEDFVLGKLSLEQFIIEITDGDKTSVTGDEAPEALSQIIQSFPKDEGNNIIKNIISNDIDLYKNVKKNNRGILIDDVIKIKMEKDSNFRTIYRKIIVGNDSKYDVFNVNFNDGDIKDRGKDLLDFFRDVFEYAAFYELTGYEIGGNNGMYFFKYLYDIENATGHDHIASQLTLNSVYNDVLYMLGEAGDEMGQVAKKIYDELIELTTNLEDKMPEMYNHDVITLWLLDKHERFGTESTIKKQFLKDGYLDSINLVGDDEG